jgi:hypothetical protein
VHFDNNLNFESERYWIADGKGGETSIYEYGDVIAAESLNELRG